MREPLRWQDGTLAAAEGTDLAGVARQLDDEALLFWLGRFRELPVLFELEVLETEANRRNADWLAGPLWRQ